MDSERASLMTKEDVRNLVAAVIQEYCSPDRNQESTLKAGNELTLSLFSELRYALGSPSLTSEPTKQLLPAEITSNGYLEFKKTPPAWATHMIVVRSGQKVDDKMIPVPGGNPPPPIDLSKNASAVIAVKLSDANGAVRLVTFVTHVRRNTSTGSTSATGTPSKATGQTTQVKTP